MSLDLNFTSIRIQVMSTTMDNLEKMFKVARETAGESSGTTPSVAKVEAVLVRLATLMVEDDELFKE